MERIIFITNMAFLGILLFAVLLYSIKIVFWIIGLKKQKRFEKAKQKHKFAIVVPARFESQVIGGLLDSIKNQTYDKDYIDTYVIVPDETDETINICKNYENTEAYILDHKVNCKGATLDAFFKDLLKNNPDKYEGFFIIDADNILKEDFVELMNDAYDTGKYDIVLGGRSNKNYKDGWVSNCSLITFSLLNGLNNKARTKFGGCNILSGSGLLLDKKIIAENGGWPWQSLTEDVELSQFSILKDYRSCYYEHARVYDEQPHNLKQNKKQIFRWVKGRSDVNKIYRNKVVKKCFAKDTKHKVIIFDFLYGLVPAVTVVVAFVLFAIANFAYIFMGVCLKNPAYISAIYNTVFAIVGLLLVFYFYILLGMIADRENLKNISCGYRITALLMSPVFFFRYVPLFFKAMFVKEVKWDRIEHKTSAVTQKKDKMSDKQ